MKKKAKTGKVKSGRKRSAPRDLSARTAGTVKGGLWFPFVGRNPGARTVDGGSLGNIKGE